MKKTFQYFLFFITILLSGCNLGYKGPAISDKEKREIKDKDNFHAMSANKIIDKNEQNRDKRKRKDNRDRKKEQKYLNELNSSSNNKVKKHKKPNPFLFY